MEKISTIQRREKLNNVYRMDKESPEGAHHNYLICDSRDECMASSLSFQIIFQKGPRNAEGSQHGIIDTDLLEIVRDRLKSFQSGPFSCRENACALTHIEEALMWLNKRVEDRIERNVLGKNEK